MEAAENLSLTRMQHQAYSARLLLFACSCASSDSASLPLR